MADRLADAGDQGANLTQATFLEYVGRHEDIDREILDAKETVRSLNKRRKDLRKTIIAVGINLDAFDRHLRDVDRSGEEREAEDDQYRRYMRWRLKPVGYQPGLFDTGDEPLTHDVDLEGVEADGFEAGRSGARADSSTWTPGTPAHDRWHAAWLRGQEQAVMHGPVGNGANGAEQPTRRRGRPPGSRDSRPRTRRSSTEQNPEPPQAA